jgi:amino acid adenylation domain-containing protein/non-ribosomal peptide synthase protein (TIGR01720 family)
MESREFILYLKSIGVGLSLFNGDLKLRVEGDISAETLAAIKERKESLIRLLTEKKNVQGDTRNIPSAAAQDSYPLSHSQQRFWMVSQIADSSRAYNIPGLLLFEGPLDTDILAKSIREVVTRHESLRTVFRENESGDIRQYILPAGVLPLDTVITDLSTERDQQALLQGIFAQEQLDTFDLQQGPLLRTRIVKLGANKFAFFYTMHHIISDGWSMEVLSGEVISNYNAYKQGLTPSIHPLKIQYKDYAAWQFSQLEEPVYKEQERYWLEQFAGELPVLDLPSVKNRPATKTHRGAALVKALPQPVVSKLKALCLKEGGTLFMGLLAGLKALFYRYTGQEDIIIGSPVAGREHRELEDQIGLYINTLALRTRFSGTDSFTALLRKEKSVLLDAYRHQAYPYDMLVERLHLKKDHSRLPLFDVIVGLQNQASANIYDRKVSFDGLTISGVPGMQTLTSQFDLSFTFIEAGQELKLSLIYNTDIYSEEEVADLYQHFETLLQHVVADPEVPLRSIAWLPVTVQQQLQEVFSGALNMPATVGEDTIVQLFETQARQTPDAVAIVHGEQQVSYRQLNEAANRVANYLREAQQVGSGQLVGLLAERSAEMVIGLLGILKAGAGYVPIDASYPEERISYMLADAGIRLLLTGSGIAPMTPVTGIPLAAATFENYADTNPGAAITLPDVAYMIYTSGSTGAPKGVMVTHGNAMHFFAHVRSRYGCRPGTYFPFVASHSFDISLFQLLTPLLTGGASVMADRAVLDDMAAFTRLLKTVTMIDTVPGVYNLLTDYIMEQEPENTFGHIEKIFIGGDVIPDHLLKKLAATFTAATIVVTYGPTEGTIFCTTHPYVPGAVEATSSGSLIGKPVSGSLIYILDSELSLLPSGVTGEICIGGAGVAAGYHQQAALTAEKFVANPYRTDDRLYRTGDLARWTPDGEVVFMGRRDTQVKIRGFRIETGEIERALVNHAVIREAVVMAREAAGSKYLAAYFVAAEALTPTDIRTYLSAYLPEYMIPAYFIQLAHLPLTANGKVDRNALPEPGDADMGRSQAYVAAGTDMEARMVKIWEEVLGRTGIGIHDNFFESGGDSIKSIQIGSRIRKYGYTLSVGDILQYPTPAEQALKVVPLVHQADQGELTGEVILSPIQRIFLEGAGSTKHHFNQSVLLYSRDTIDEAGIREIFGALYVHHDVLRLRFIEENGTWRQEYSTSGDGFSLQEFNWREIEKAAALELMGNAAQQLQSSMILSDGPLIRLGLFRLQDGDRLLIAIHHLVMDGISLQILLEDMTTLHQQYLHQLPFSLPGKSDAFKYWMEQQQVYARTSQLLKEKDFWKKLEMSQPGKLPLDHVPQQNLVKDTINLVFSLSKEHTHQLLTTVNKAFNTEIDDILLTALGLSLRETFSLQQVMIEMEGHGRQKIADNADVSRTVGWFTSAYPVVLDMGFTGDLSRQLIEVKETLRMIPNKGIGYNILQYLSDREQVADMQFNLRPDIRFNYLGQFSDAVFRQDEQAYFSFTTEYKGREISESAVRNVAIEVTGILFEGVLNMQIGFNTEQFDRATIEKLRQSYEENLKMIIAHCVQIKEPQITPSDLGDAEISIEELNNLFN